MKKWITTICLVAVSLAFSTCQNYQVGAAFEPWENGNSLGAYFAGETSEYFENSLFYFHDFSEMAPLGIGYDLSLKVPIDFVRNRLSIFPMASFEGRYIHSTFDFTEFEPSDVFGLGLKFGAGLDINFTNSLFLRGKVQYQPEQTTWMSGHPGLRFSVGLGFRTADDPIRRSISRSGQQAARTTGQSDEELERQFQRAIERNPNNPRPYFERGNSLRTRNRIRAIELWEKALELDPDFRVTENISLDRGFVTSIGVVTSETIRFNDFSLYLFLGSLRYDEATGSGSRIQSVPEDDTTRRRLLENALDALRRGYEIDISRGRNNSRNVRIAYLGYIASTLDYLRRSFDATESYTELAGITTVTAAIGSRTGTTTSQRVPANLARIHIPAWVKGGMSLDDIRRALPGITLTEGSESEYTRMYQYRRENIGYFFFINNEKGLVFYIVGGRSPAINVQNVQTDFIQRYGRPGLHDNEYRYIALSSIEDIDSLTPEGVFRINIIREGDTTQIQYLFGINFFED